MKASLIVSVLAEFIASNGDTDVTVSVDVSTGEDDAFKRVFGEIAGIQQGNSEITILADGVLNEE